MCGRFSLTLDVAILNEYFKLKQSFCMRPRYNIAPSEMIPVLKQPSVVEFLRWGIIPQWNSALNKPINIINIRSETLLEKPTFGEAFKKRRCLIMADGFYEWKNIGRSKQPFYIRRQDKSPFAIAGIWEGESVAILTREASSLLLPIHARMPVIIPSTLHEQWLDPNTNQGQQIVPMLQINLATTFEFYPVSPKVNKVTFDSKECTLPLH